MIDYAKSPQRSAPGLAQANTLTPAPQPQRENIVRNITEQLNDRLKQLHSHSSRLTALSDRLLGVRPEEAGCGATAGGPTCEIENLGACVPFLDYLIDQMATQIGRLEQL